MEDRGRCGCRRELSTYGPPQGMRLHWGPSLIQNFWWASGWWRQSCVYCLSSPGKWGAYLEKQPPTPPRLFPLPGYFMTCVGDVAHGCSGEGTVTRVRFGSESSHLACRRGILLCTVGICGHFKT